MQAQCKATDVAAGSGAHTRPIGPVAGARIPPGSCWLCVPIVRVVEDGYFRTISEARHEADCAQNQNTQLSKEL